MRTWVWETCGWRLQVIARPEGRSHWLRAAHSAARFPALVASVGGGGRVHSAIANRLGLRVARPMRKIGLVGLIQGITDLDEYGEMHVAGRRYVGVAPLEPGERNALFNVALVVDEVRDGRAPAGKLDEFLLRSLHTCPRLRGRIESLHLERQTLAIGRVSVHARRLSDAHLLLVRDATSYCDPFTGEGIYRALRSARLMADVALPALACDDLSAASLSAYDHSYHKTVRGKHTAEQIFQLAVQTPFLMNHIAHMLQGQKGMADTMIAVTGDFLPTSAVLRPGYLLRLLV